jgi:hypothetical protein
MATLKTFLQTGELGPIRPGMRQSEAIAVLGPPPDESVARHPKILKYGGLQLTFSKPADGDEARLDLIGLQFGPHAEPSPAATTPGDFKATSETTITEIREFLARAGLKEDAFDQGEDTSYVHLPSGARITFDGQKLWSIHFAARTRSLARKQVSISIPKGIWDQLRRHARKSNRSVGDLCAEWITQRANELQEDNVTPPVPAR